MRYFNLSLLQQDATSYLDIFNPQKKEENQVQLKSYHSYDLFLKSYYVTRYYYMYVIPQAYGSKVNYIQVF